MTGLLVPATSLASRLGLTEPLAPQVQQRLEDAILDAQAKVSTNLRRPLVADLRPVTGLAPLSGWPLSDHRAWPHGQALFNDRYRVESYTTNADDTELYDVTFKVGLDVSGDPELYPILSFIKRDAVADVTNDPLFTAITRAVTSVSAAGQSVTYAKAGSAAGAVGAPAGLDTLKQWRRLAIHQSPATRRNPWPYQG